jgi:hypothetical protein
MRDYSVAMIFVVARREVHRDVRSQNMGNLGRHRDHRPSAATTLYLDINESRGG